MKELTGMSTSKALFVVEYLKHGVVTRACDAHGVSVVTAQKWLKEPAIEQLVGKMIFARMKASNIDAEWALMESVDNHYLARADGNIAGSNSALRNIMNHAAVDAFAAEKVLIASDEAIKDRLLRGRRRMNEPEPEPVLVVENFDELNFL